MANRSRICGDAGTNNVMATEQDIISSAKVIREGGLVAFPTETVYGLGANALDAAAVAQIFELKGRPRFDPLIVHVASSEELPLLVERVPPLARDLIARFWPGPLSVVLRKRACVPDVVTAGLPSVAVRCPAHPVAIRGRRSPRQVRMSFAPSVRPRHSMSLSSSVTGCRLCWTADRVKLASNQPSFLFSRTSPCCSDRAELPWRKSKP